TQYSANEEYLLFGIGERRDDRMLYYVQPVYMNIESGNDVGKKDKRKIFQIFGIGGIGAIHLKQEREYGKSDHNQGKTGFWKNELDSFCHGAKVCSYIEDIRRDKKKRRKVEDFFRIMLSDVCSQTLSRHKPDASAHFLDNSHERKGKEREPDELESELCASLRIGGNARWIVI